ncbi:MAG TPA: hypothetical protein VI389_01385 [Geobacteraceae bacterium]
MKRWGIAVAAVVASATGAGAMVGESRESAGSADKQVVTRASEEKTLKPAALRKEPAVVDVKLNVLESLERLQERKIKEPRRIKPQP